jgi:hypothetical protein
MQRISKGIQFLTLCLWVFTVPSNGQDHSAVPVEQFKALRQEYDLSSSSGIPLTDAERLKFIGLTYQRRNAIAQKFLALAERYPSDPMALDALIQSVWQVNTVPWPIDLVGEDSTRARAFALILRDHLHSEKLGPLCQRVSNGLCKEYETFLRSVLANNPHTQVKATACLALGQFLHGRMLHVDLCRQQPELAREFAGLFGKDYLADLVRQDQDKAVKEMENLFEQAAAKYGIVKLPGGTTVAERAQAALFEIRNLTVGKHVPELEGADQNGRRFKLSDYRGKVLLLDFWSYA